jgi:hypothetical protein
MSDELHTSRCGCSSQPAPETVADAHGLTEREALRQMSGIGTFKGELLTQALAASGYTTDPSGLRAYYRDHTDVLDGYLKYVDIEEVVGQLGASMTGRTGCAAQGADMVALGVGFMGGVAAAGLYQVFSDNDNDGA